MSVTYITENRKTPLKEWLEKNKPSEKSSKEGLKWIRLHRKPQNEASLMKLLELKQDWRRIKMTGETINKQAIINLAVKHNLTCGKWLFYPKVGKEVNSQWHKVAVGTDKGSIPAISAKVSTSSPGQRQHLICVYNDNFTNKEEVFSLEQGLRNAGITCTMYYKPDIYTYLGIYTGNPWGLKASVYSSYFSNSTTKSQIKCT